MICIEISVLGIIRSIEYHTSTPRAQIAWFACIPIASDNNIILGIAALVIEGQLFPILSNFVISALIYGRIRMNSNAGNVVQPTSYSLWKNSINRMR